MVSNTFWARGVFFVMFCLCASAVQAEQKKIFSTPGGDEYEVHYIAFSSTFLTPDIARQYGLSRSKALGVVNISVLKRKADGSTEAVGALVDLNAKNDIQQVRHLDVNQVVEGKSIYYIGQVQYREGEVLTFDVSVFPQGVADPLKLRFSQTFYND